MKYIIAFAALAACAFALPLDKYPVSVSLDTTGNYKLKYQVEDSARHEESNNGQVFGSYEFTDKSGEHHKIYYLAGVQGYLPEGKSLPVPVHLTPEVARATEEHKALYRKIASELPVLSRSETDPTSYVEHHEIVPQYIPQYNNDDIYNYRSEGLSGPKDAADVAALKALHQLATDHTAHFTH